MAGNIDEEVAFEAASSPHDFKLMLAGAGPARERHRAGAPAEDAAEAATSAPLSCPLPTSVRKALAILGCAVRGSAASTHPPGSPIRYELTTPCPVGRCAEIISGKWTLLVIRDLADGSQPLLRARALARGHQPAHALAAPAGARGARDRRAPHLSRGPAAGRVRAHREGPRPGAADRGHARLRAALARRASAARRIRG